MACHAAQGYAPGAVCGVAQPLRIGGSLIWPQSRLNTLSLTVKFVMLYLLGLLGLGVALRRMSRQVSANERMQEALRESEQSYRSQFASNLAVMLLADPTDGSLVDANARRDRLLWLSARASALDADDGHQHLAARGGSGMHGIGPGGTRPTVRFGASPGGWLDTGCGGSGESCPVWRAQCAALYCSGHHRPQPCRGRATAEQGADQPIAPDHRSGHLWYRSGRALHIHQPVRSEAVGLRGRGLHRQEHARPCSSQPRGWARRTRRRSARSSARN